MEKSIEQGVVNAPADKGEPEVILKDNGAAGKKEQEKINKEIAKEQKELEKRIKATQEAAKKLK
jgi:hypothetical protein